MKKPETIWDASLSQIWEALGFQIVELSIGLGLIVLAFWIGSVKKARQKEREFAQEMINRMAAINAEKEAEREARETIKCPVTEPNWNGKICPFCSKYAAKTGKSLTRHRNPS